MQKLLEGKTMKTSSRFAFALLSFGILSVGAQASLVGYYSFDPGTVSGNTVRDLSGNGNDGTLGSAATVTSNGVTFNGTANSFVSLPIDVGPSTMPEVTMGGWFDLTANPTLPTVGPVAGLLSSDDGGFCRSLEVDRRSGTGAPSYGSFAWSAFAGPDEGVVRGTTVASNQWVFVAMTSDVDTGEFDLYVDGQKYQSYADTFNDGTSNLVVGRSATFQEYFTGNAKDVFVFNSALSDSQIDTLRTQGVQAVPEPTSLAALGLGAIAFFRKRRNRK